MLDEKDKAQRLQTELDVSEQVQRDFVKLSQTLQVDAFSMKTTTTKKKTALGVIRGRCTGMSQSLCCIIDFGCTVMFI